MKVYNLTDAMNWFIENRTGSIICVKDNKEIECNCYPDAKNFFKEDNNG